MELMENYCMVVNTKGLQSNLHFRMISSSEWWFKPIIPATQEAEIGRIWFKTSPSKKLVIPPSQSINWASWFTPVVPAMRKA
jgi:hypothetical protein